MIKTKDDLILNTKVQVTAICDDLAQHFSTIDRLISEEGPIQNLVIRGHIEAHLEKIEDSIVDICHKYEINDKHITGKNQSEQKDLRCKTQTQKQGMKLLLVGIQNLEIKVSSLLSKAAKRAQPSQANPLRELFRKLENDLCRTSYLLQ